MVVAPDIVVPPSVLRAWLALSTAPESAFRRGAVVHVATILGGTKQYAHKALSQAEQAGLIIRLPGGGLLVARPLGLTSEECSRICAREGEDMAKKVMVRGVEIDIDAAIPVESDGASPGLVPPGDPQAFRARVRTVPGVRKRGTSWEDRTQTFPKAEILAEEWIACRRTMMPSVVPWQPSRADRDRFAKAVKALEALNIPQSAWRIYVQWIWTKAWGRYASRVPYALTSWLDSPKFLDWFLEAVGPRSVDREQVAEMLEAAGFEDVHPAMVIEMATDFGSRQDRLPATLKPRTQQAVRWLWAHLDEVKMQASDWEVALEEEVPNG